MKRISVLLGLLFLLGGCACREQHPPRKLEGPQVGQNGGVEPVPQPRGEHHFGPPPEAFKACEEKTAGSTAQFTGPEGEAVTGTCQVADNRLVLRPDHPRDNSRDGHRGPPPEAYKACEGKSAGSPAQFVNPRGEAVNGTCEDENGKLVLRPDNRRGDGQGPSHEGPGKERNVRMK